jgi:hypothetical protein
MLINTRIEGKTVSSLMVLHGLSNSFSKAIKEISNYAQTLFLGTRSDVLISSILAATMKSVMLKPPAIQWKIVKFQVLSKRSFNSGSKEIQEREYCE